MKNNFHLANKIEKILISIDSIEKASPKPFLYSRVMARLAREKENLWEKWSSVFLKPATVFACICFVVIMNIAAIFYNNNSAVQAAQNELTTSDEYTQLATNFYDFENVKP